MANVLTSASSITCGHQGKVSTTSAAKLTVDGNPVLTEIGRTVSNCLLKDDPNTGTVQCKSTSITGGKASKLQVDGSPVMLDTVKGTTEGGAPPPLPPLPPLSINILANQSKLIAS